MCHLSFILCSGQDAASYQRNLMVRLNHTNFPAFDQEVLSQFVAFTGVYEGNLGNACRAKGVWYNRRLVDFGKKQPYFEK
jgi:hypothetical protein